MSTSLLWNVNIGQSTTPVRTQNRVVYIRIHEKFGYKECTVRVKNPTSSERNQVVGRIDNALITIKRGSTILFEGFIEDRENGDDYVEYFGRSFLILLGYSTSSTTDDSGDTKAEFENDTGQTIIETLITDYCKDPEIGFAITFPQEYGGDVPLHGKKVYQIVSNMCKEYGYDLWATSVYSGNDISGKIINVGTKGDGSPGSPNMTLTGGVNFANIPKVRYNSSKVINQLRVIGGGTGKEKVSEIVKDQPSQDAIGIVEGDVYNNNMIRNVATAKLVGEAIIAAKKDPITEISIRLITYINGLKYGDWVRIVDAHSGIDTVKRIKAITMTYDIKQADKMDIEVGEKFDDYQNIIRDLTKGDVEGEPEMAVGGGSLRITANDPANTYVRIDAGKWYGTDSILYSFYDTIQVFWGGIPKEDPPYNPNVVNNYCKALVQVKNDPTSITDFTYKTNLTFEDRSGYVLSSDAEDEVITVDKENMPIGELILKCESVTEGYGYIYPITALNEGGSYIYRDARPIIGSTGGAGLWQEVGDPVENVDLIEPYDIDIHLKKIMIDKETGIHGITGDETGCTIISCKNGAFVGIKEEDL